MVWAERNGYPLDYAVNADLEDPEALAGYALYLSIGHDEYWSMPMRDSVEAFIGRGGNVAFLSGNTAFGRSAWRTAGSGWSATRDGSSGIPSSAPTAGTR